MKTSVFARIQHCGNCCHFTQTCSNCGYGVCNKDGEEKSKPDVCDQWGKR